MPTPSTPYAARAFNPAHPLLPNGAGAPAQLANERYVESLARLVYYWGYPAVDGFGRTSAWELMKDGPGATMGLFPGAPKNTMGYLDDYMSPAQRKVVTPNNDTIYGVCFADLTHEPLVIQTPESVPAHHYWTIQITDVFTTVLRQLGSASATPGGKFLLAGPDWHGEVPTGYVDVIRSPTNVAGIFGRSFTAHTPESKQQARAVLNQIGVVPLSKDQPHRWTFDCEASARNKVYPKGVTPEMVAADPDMLRVRPVNAVTFWDDLQKALDFNPQVSADDAAMADQARTLLALRQSSDAWKALLDRTALSADAELHEGARFHQTGVDAGNGWQKQENGGLWGTDWFGRAQAAVIYIYVNDFHEAVYFIRGTDSKANLLQGRYHYTLTFAKGALPPVDRERGGFWSLTMYDRDYYMLSKPENGRTNIGTVSLEANELKFAADGSLTLHLSHAPPPGEDALANWLQAPDDQFALIVRAYVPDASLLDGSHVLPEVVRA
ncbi:DUF1254 domain-containing protein [Pseudoxanthomonas indica]|uniref:Uncharacterized conserved protein n=1 Tax=Pseudoxanthomonas indica TaxID=428993 RepID=A0A1T5KA32_9GAMM|nr:DUF1254 domain-containing protein [Pseudoxanthomonas indica]GGD47919.1 hypothetical protein GCM10007235_19720 [Pseudoxanthomonas indica]SKC60543.1 Uncharacterized conserved protein [Pseudoxanthomonas indica]